MRKLSEWQNAFETQQLKDYFAWLYGGDTEFHIARYTAALDEFKKIYGDKEVALFSAPGRTEVGGNHTDHQHGVVLAAAVTMDMIAVVAPRDDMIINFVSHGFDTDIVDLNILSKLETECGRSASLIRGICARISQLGYNIGGFDAYQISNVPKGSGLSSSAALEVLIGTIQNGLYNENAIPMPDIAKIGQYAENNYFDKPCGLMDQTASAVGSMVSIDFKNFENPSIQQVPFDLGKHGYELCVVNAGGSHSDLTDEYASIPVEMKQVASFFNKDFLREVDEDLFFESIDTLRKSVSDRALLRAIHFFTDNKYAQLERKALETDDIEMFLELVNKSGDSSFTSLQNCFPSNSASERSVALALVLSKKVLGGSGASRVHGGGFAGTILAVVPFEKIDAYVREMEAVFGKGSCFPLKVRPVGGVMIPSSVF